MFAFFILLIPSVVLFANSENEVLNVPENKLKTTKVEIEYKPLDGFLEKTVRDSNGALVAYMITSNLEILDDRFAYNSIQEWPTEKMISPDGQTFEILKKQNTLFVKQNMDISRTGIGFIAEFDLTPNDLEEPDSVQKTIWLIGAHHNQLTVEKGDQITSTYRIFKPVS